MAIKRTKATRAAVPVKRRRPAAKKVTRARSSDAGDTTSKPMLIGYARVSTVDQNLALQRDALTEAGCQKIFNEQMSGAVADRLEARPPAAFDEAVDRNRRESSGKRHRVSQPNRGPRHDDSAGAAGFSHVWRARRIRAQSDPGAHPSGPRRRSA